MDKKDSGKITFTIDKFTAVLLVVIIGLAFAVGMLFQKVNNLEKGSTVANNGAVNDPSAQGPLSGKLDSAKAALLPKVTDDDRIRGSKDAEVILVEYSDFQCPFCAAFHPTAEQAMKEYGNKIAWVYRHFPLDSLHPVARPAANASECIVSLAGNDAFWKFADSIFTAVNAQEDISDLTPYITASGANVASVKACATQKKFESIVDDQYAGGAAAGVSGTPGNFIVNKKGEVWSLPGAVPYATLKQTIEEALGN